jgi:hypothetical protein
LEDRRGGETWGLRPAPERLSGSHLAADVVVEVVATPADGPITTNRTIRFGRKPMESLDTGGRHGQKKWATFQESLKRRPHSRP